MLVSRNVERGSELKRRSTLPTIGLYVPGPGHGLVHFTRFPESEAPRYCPKRGDWTPIVRPYNVQNLTGKFWGEPRTRSQLEWPYETERGARELE